MTWVGVQAGVLCSREPGSHQAPCSHRKDRQSRALCFARSCHRVRPQVWQPVGRSPSRGRGAPCTSVGAPTLFVSALQRCLETGELAGSRGPRKCLGGVPPEPHGTGGRVLGARRRCVGAQGLVRVGGSGQVGPPPRGVAAAYSTLPESSACGCGQGRVP